MRLISTILPILANVIAVSALYCTANGVPWPDEAGPGQVCNKHLYCQINYLPESPAQCNIELRNPEF
ncbi:hypothetical protein HYFRA_00007856 [Hymenoscyphus fraxineus]|uniref:Secreted protein n=1 Tax=Hymenoscyphus fraxineus TaxID=746836 RepID=A0A9N9KMB3_9HELO|nr:hypothetical protein HYFRA_00007856 [Hymenoscyphus fraxineus]